MNQYSNNLTEGQKEMFRTYPDTFKMPVYQTRRTAAAPEWVYENTYKNALRAELADGGNSLLYSYAGIPFPILSDNKKHTHKYQNEPFNVVIHINFLKLFRY